MAHVTAAAGSSGTSGAWHRASGLQASGLYAGNGVEDLGEEIEDLEEEIEDLDGEDETLGLDAGRVLPAQDCAEERGADGSSSAGSDLEARVHYIYTYIHYVPLCLCLCICIYVYKYICKYVCAEERGVDGSSSAGSDLEARVHYIYIHLYILYTYIYYMLYYVYVYVYVYLFMYIFIYVCAEERRIDGSSSAASDLEAKA